MQTQTTSFQALENVIKAVKVANKAGLFELEDSHLLAESLKVLSNVIIQLGQNIPGEDIQVEDKEPVLKKAK